MAVGADIEQGRTFSPEERESVFIRLDLLEREVRDHSQRFDTLQTPWWKRLWFLIDGWPWYDLNGSRHRRPWHRSR